MKCLRRGGAPAPALFISPAAQSTVVTSSRDSRRVRTSTTPVFTNSSTAAYFEEDPKTNAALDSSDFNYSLGDNTLNTDAEVPENDRINVILVTRRNKNSVSICCSFAFLL